MEFRHTKGAATVFSQGGTVRISFSTFADNSRGLIGAGNSVYMPDAGVLEIGDTIFADQLETIFGAPPLSATSATTCSGTTPQYTATSTW